MVLVTGREVDAELSDGSGHGSQGPAIEGNSVGPACGLFITHPIAQLLSSNSLRSLLLDYVVQDPMGKTVVDRMDIEEQEMRALERSVAGARVRGTKPS